METAGWLADELGVVRSRRGAPVSSIISRGIATAASVSPYQSRRPGLAGEFEPLGREGVAGNGALLAPATSNPRLACEDNGCLIFSIRRAQCRILSFTRGGASEVISQRHSARTLLLCGGREDGGGAATRTPALARISRGAGCAAAATSKGPGGPDGLWEPGLAPAGAPAACACTAHRDRASCAGLRRSWAEAVRWCRGGWCRSPSHSHFHQDLKCFSSFESWESKGKGGKKGVRGARGMGSLTQSNDLRGVEQMVPLTSAAERTRLSGPPARALTSPARPPNASIGPPGGLRSEGSPTARLLPSAPCLGRWSRNTRTSRPPGRDGGLG